MKNFLLFIILMIVVIVAGCRDHKGVRHKSDDWFSSPTNPAHPLSPLNPTNPANPNNILWK